MAPTANTPAPATPQQHDSLTGLPLAWAPPASGDGPTEITVALVEHNIYSTPTQGNIDFLHDWPAQFTPLLKAAEEIWEELANVRFVNLGTDDPANLADIRVGVADIRHNINLPQAIAFAAPNWDENSGHFTHSSFAIQDPSVSLADALGNGDYEWRGSPATVFQALVSSLGTMLGLDFNRNDPASVMNPLPGRLNGLPDAEDVRAVQAMYGPGPMTTSNLSPGDLAALNNLVAPFVRSG